jgi:predicted RNA binding protein with dsRBD fold (UPF0201 family)
MNEIHKRTKKKLSKFTNRIDTQDLIDKLRDVNNKEFKELKIRFIKHQNQIVNKINESFGLKLNKLTE